MPDFWQFFDRFMGLVFDPGNLPGRLLGTWKPRGFIPSAQSLVLPRRRDEPESGLLPGQPQKTFVINCNLQRLDFTRFAAQVQDHPGTRRRVPRCSVERTSKSFGAASGTHCWPSDADANPGRRRDSHHLRKLRIHKAGAFVREHFNNA